MANALSQMTASFAAAIALLGASNAYASGTAEVTEATASTADVTGVSGQASATSGIILAGNQRATNLQKTSTAIIVAGIDAGISVGRKSRAQR